jgi:peptide-methionine (S)-S-oxide reductase
MKRIAVLTILVFTWAAQAVAAEGAMTTKKAAFGAGCFWGVEKIFRKVPGVVDTRVGYAGGTKKNPTYKEVCTGATGHAEAVEVTYDPSKVSYEKLLAVFFEWHDPTTEDRQGPDVGSQYRSVIFAYDDEQGIAARKAIDKLEKEEVYDEPIVTEVVPAGEFWAAEEYHQRYLEKNPLGYCSHRKHTDKPEKLLVDK